MTECYFNNIDYYIKKYLSKAQTSVCIVVAWINTSLFEAEFSQLVQKNVQITIMYNDDFINAKIIKKQAGIIYIPIRMPSSKNKMHDKFCIIDGRFVSSGSYNWFKNANANFENVIINDDRLTVAKFQNEFYELTNVNSLYEDAKDNGKCINCGHKTFRLGVIQNIDEEKCLDRVDVFEVCSFDTGHNRFLKVEYYQELTNFLNKDENKAHPKLKKYLSNSIKHTTNLQMTKIEEILCKFDECWVETLKKDVDYQEYRDSLQSIYVNRNKIAHGEISNIGFKSLEDSYVRIQKFFERLVKVMGS